MEKRSASHQTQGTGSAKGLNPLAAEKIRSARSRKLDVQELGKRLTAGEQPALSQGITLVENSHPRNQAMAAALIELCLPSAGKSLRIGITGVPGVGKSTFIEAFGEHLADQGHKIAVLAVDPSSSISGGSILGDKTRMERLVSRPEVFIRPSPSGHSLGGVARKTRESIVLCEAAGFDIILIETVGVGQSETTVHSMTDFFLLLKLAGAGDELQGIKRGIMEMADAIVINKADGSNLKPARRAGAEFRRALHLYPEKSNGWEPEVLLCSALEKKGIAEIWEMVHKFEKLTRETGAFSEKRREQNKHWLLQTIEEHLKSNFYNDPRIKELLPAQLQAIDRNQISPFEAARKLLEEYS